VGGKRSGVSRKSGQLPKVYRDGWQLSRRDRRRAELRAHFRMADAVLADSGDAPTVLRTRVTHRAVHLDALLQRLEGDLADGKAVDVATYLSGCQAFLRYAAALGLERRAKRLPGVVEYLAAKAADGAAAPPGEGAP